MANQAKKGSRSTPAFDPLELDDLIHIPAVGTGVSSHLLQRQPAQVTTVVKKEKATVVISKPPTPPAAAVLWKTEAGTFVTPDKIRPVQVIDDVLAAAEKTALEYLTRAAAGGQLVQAGYEEILRGTGLSRKTVQRTIAKLLDKDFLIIETAANIYTREPTVYRLVDPDTVMRQHERKGRRFVVHIGPGVVYATPAATNQTTVE